MEKKATQILLWQKHTLSLHHCRVKAEQIVLSAVVCSPNNVCPLTRSVQTVRAISSTYYQQRIVAATSRGSCVLLSPLFIFIPLLGCVRVSTLRSVARPCSRSARCAYIYSCWDAPTKPQDLCCFVMQARQNMRKKISFHFLYFFPKQISKCAQNLSEP